MLPDDAAPVALCPCGRRRPVGPVVGYWTPSEATLAALERALPGKILEYGEFPELASRTRRQYLGIIRPDHRAIYVNAFSKDLRVEWRSTVVRKCAWDKRYFGVEYDVDSGRFTHMSFQGTA